MPFGPISIELSLETRFVGLRAFALSLVRAVCYFRLDGERIGCVGIGRVVAHLADVPQLAIGESRRSDQALSHRA